VLDELFGAREKLAAPEQEAFAGAGHTDPATRALEDPDAQLGLEAVDLPPKSRLSDTESCGGSREGARLGDRDEVAEVAQIHCLPGIA
jgi:hypothetical protein